VFNKCKKTKYGYVGGVFHRILTICLITKTSQLVLFREVTLCSQNYKKFINILCGKLESFSMLMQIVCVVTTVL
jgi:hypothetical protein